MLFDLQLLYNFLRQDFRFIRSELNNKNSCYLPMQ